MENYFILSLKSLACNLTWQRAKTTFGSKPALSCDHSKKSNSSTSIDSNSKVRFQSDSIFHLHRNIVESPQIWWEDDVWHKEGDINLSKSGRKVLDMIVDIDVHFFYTESITLNSYFDSYIFTSVCTNKRVSLLWIITLMNLFCSFISSHLADIFLSETPKIIQAEHSFLSCYWIFFIKLLIFKRYEKYLLFYL